MPPRGFVIPLQATGPGLSNEPACAGLQYEANDRHLRRQPARSFVSSFDGALLSKDSKDAMGQVLHGSAQRAPVPSLVALNRFDVIIPVGIDHRDADPWRRTCAIAAETVAQPSSTRHISSTNMPGATEPAQNSCVVVRSAPARRQCGQPCDLTSCIS
jgi:hypothetical protein